MTTESQEEAAVLADLTHQRSHKIESLTGVRGYAACWVVLHHFWLTAAQFRPVRPLASVPIVASGYLGVDLFFLLSGFVLMLIYGRSMSDFGAKSIARFWIGRIFRILPLHWFVLLLFAVSLPFIGDHWVLAGPFTWSGLITSILLVQSWVFHPNVWNVTAWSLSTEWLAYLVFPLLAWIIRRVHRRVTVLFSMVPLFLVLLLVTLFSHQAGLNHAVRLGLVRCLCEFPIGMLICRSWLLKPHGMFSSEIWLIVGLGILAISLVSPRLDVLSVPAFGLLIYIMADEGVLSRAMFGNKVTHLLGELSFSIYMIHAFLLNIAAKIADQFAPTNTIAMFGALLTAILAMIPCAWLTWRFLEVPAIAWGRVIGRQLQNTRPTSMS